MESLELMSKIRFTKHVLLDVHFSFAKLSLLPSPLSCPGVRQLLSYPESLQKCPYWHPTATLACCNPLSQDSGISCPKCKWDHVFLPLSALQQFSLAFGPNFLLLALIFRVPRSLLPSLFQSWYMLPTIVRQLSPSESLYWSLYCALGNTPVMFLDHPHPPPKPLPPCNPC